MRWMSHSVPFSPGGNRRHNQARFSAASDTKLPVPVLGRQQITDPTKLELGSLAPQQHTPETRSRGAHPGMGIGKQLGDDVDRQHGAVVGPHRLRQEARTCSRKRLSQLFDAHEGVVDKDPVLRRRLYRWLRNKPGEQAEDRLKHLCRIVRSLCAWRSVNEDQARALGTGPPELQTLVLLQPAKGQVPHLGEGVVSNSLQQACQGFFGFLAHRFAINRLRQSLQEKAHHPHGAYPTIKILILEVRNQLLHQDVQLLVGERIRDEEIDEDLRCDASHAGIEALDVDLRYFVHEIVHFGGQQPSADHGLDEREGCRLRIGLQGRRLEEQQEDTKLLVVEKLPLHILRGILWPFLPILVRDESRKRLEGAEHNFVLVRLKRLAVLHHDR
eukprot:scaffold1499_cov255-Pinguiococcus_pyrenoidosus.AAC.5